MASPTDTSTLSGLTPREAVADALARCLRGIDSNDRALFASACRQDETMRVEAGPISMDGWTSINRYFQIVFELVTTHLTSNVRIVDLSDKEAKLQAHAIAYHIRPAEALIPEDKSYTVGCLYDLDLVKDGTDGLWKIQTWKITPLWSTGDRAVVHP